MPTLPDSRPPQVSIARDFQPSRLASQLLGAAYELALPLIRRALASPRPEHTKAGARRARQGKTKAAQGGSLS